MSKALSTSIEIIFKNTDFVMLTVRVSFNPIIFSNFVRNGSEWKLSMFHDRISIRNGITQMKRHQNVLPESKAFFIVFEVGRGIVRKYCHLTY